MNHFFAWKWIPSFVSALAPRERERSQGNHKKCKGRFTCTDVYGSICFSMKSEAANKFHTGRNALKKVIVQPLKQIQIPNARNNHNKMLNIKGGKIKHAKYELTMIFKHIYHMHKKGFGRNISKC